jgi:hypothetical protein
MYMQVTDCDYLSLYGIFNNSLSAVALLGTAPAGRMARPPQGASIAVDSLARCPT